MVVLCIETQYPSLNMAKERIFALFCPSFSSHSHYFSLFLSRCVYIYVCVDFTGNSTTDFIISSSSFIIHHTAANIQFKHAFCMVFVLCYFSYRFVLFLFSSSIRVGFFEMVPLLSMLCRIIAVRRCSDWCAHLIMHETHNFDAPMQSSWQNAPHCWQMTIAFSEHAQFGGVFSTLSV